MMEKLLGPSCLHSCWLEAVILVLVYTHDSVPYGAVVSGAYGTSLTGVTEIPVRNGQRVPVADQLTGRGANPGERHRQYR